MNQYIPKNADKIFLYPSSASPADRDDLISLSEAWSCLIILGSV